MAVYTPIDRKQLAEIVTEYGLGKLTGIKPIVTGSVNTNYILETSKGKQLLRIDEVKHELDVKREIDLLLFLRKYGFPCPQPTQDRKGRYYRNVDGKYLTLYKWIEGRHVAVPKLTGTKLEAIGRTMAELHTLSKHFKKGIENRFAYERVAEIYADVRTKLPPYFKRITRTLDDEVDYLKHYLETKLPKGIIHGDMFPDNLLFRGDKLIAVLDFEAASRGKFVFDLATAVNALCVHEQAYRLDRFEALIGGYESLRPLSLAEWDAFPNELRLSALRFTVTRLRDFFLQQLSEDDRATKDFREFYEILRILRREREGGMESLLMAMATGYDYRKYQRVKALEKKSSK